MLEKSEDKEYNIGDKLEVLVVRASLHDLSIEVVPYEGDQENEYSIE